MVCLWQGEDQENNRKKYFFVHYLISQYSILVYRFFGKHSITHCSFFHSGTFTLIGNVIIPIWQIQRKRHQQHASSNAWRRGSPRPRKHLFFYTFSVQLMDYEWHEAGVLEEFLLNLCCFAAPPLKMDYIYGDRLCSEYFLYNLTNKCNESNLIWKVQFLVQDIYAISLQNCKQVMLLSAFCYVYGNK